MDTSMPVIDFYRTKGAEKVLEVDSTQAIDKVYNDIKTPISSLLSSQ